MILVTGGTGLVGAHLLMDLLKYETPIRAIYRSDNALEKVRKIFALYNIKWEQTLHKIEWIKSDLLNTEILIDAFKNVEYVYHCAAMVSFNKADKTKLFKVNIEGTANVVNLSLACGVKKFCHVSSTATIGKSKKDGIRHEDCIWENDGSFSNYSISKYFSEMEVWRGSEEGLNVVIVNPSIIIGPGDWTQSSSNLFLKVWNGLRYYSKGVNAFVDVRDVSKAMVELMKSPITSERFLIIGENLTFQELFNEIAISLGKRIPSIEVKRWMASLIWRIEALRSFLFGSEPLVTKESSKSALSIVKYSNDKIKTELNFKTIPIKQSIAHTSKLFLQDYSA
jgi:dihydroflavonol-4-reductase